MSYEERLAVFSPDGRLIQVEHAQKASEQGSLVVFSVDSDSISVSIERKSTNKLLVEETKLIPINEAQGIWMSYSGLKPDAYLITDIARLICRSYKTTTGEDMTIDQMARTLSDYKQRYTVVYNQRPFGVRTVLFGFNPAPVAYILEPDGNFSEFYGGAIGQRSQKVVEYLENACRDDAVRATVLGLMEVVQTDLNKISSFVISRDGYTQVGEAAIAGIISSVDQ